MQYSSSDEGGLPPPPVYRSKGRAWLLILLIPAAGLLLVAGIAVAACLYISCAVEEQLTPAEREMVFDMDDVIEFTSDLEIDRSREILKKTRHPDGSREIEYKYDDPRDETPYLTSTLSLETSFPNAKALYISMWGGLKIGLRFGGDKPVRIVERNNLFKWGDESRFGLVQCDGKTTGNIFCGRKGLLVVHVLITGLFSEDKKIISGIFDPPMGRAAGWTGK